MHGMLTCKRLVLNNLYIYFQIIGREKLALLSKNINQELRLSRLSVINKW